MTTSNAPCIRYILLRHAQTNTDAAFMNNDTSGLTVENRHELTFTGKLWCENLLDKDGTALKTFHNFARGSRHRVGAILDVAQPLAFHDGTPAAIATFERLFLRGATSSTTHHIDIMLSDHMVPTTAKQHITPVVVVCGSTFIDTAFRREFTTDTIRYAVPLMSVTMYDAFFGEAAEHGGTQWDSSFLHCLGNTHLVEGAAWACNAK